MTDIKKKFIGTWSLESVIVKHGEQLIYPFGKNPKGVLFYDEKHMSVQIMMPIDKPITEERKNQLKLEDLAHTLKTIGYMGYFGTYDIDEENGEVIHHTEGAITQNIAGKDEIRKFRFDPSAGSEECLILSKGNMELTWRKLV